VIKAWSLGSNSTCVLKNPYLDYNISNSKSLAKAVSFHYFFNQPKSC